jgi:hypothetical protein
MKISLKLAEFERGVTNIAANLEMKRNNKLPNGWKDRIGSDESLKKLPSDVKPTIRVLSIYAKDLT